MISFFGLLALLVLIGFEPVAWRLFREHRRRTYPRRRLNEIVSRNLRARSIGRTRL